MHTDGTWIRWLNYSMGRTSVDTATERRKKIPCNVIRMKVVCKDFVLVHFTRRSNVALVEMKKEEEKKTREQRASYTKRDEKNSTRV